MTPNQENALMKFIEKYFEGGNDRGNASPGTVKAILEAIRDFVLENF